MKAVSIFLLGVVLSSFGYGQQKPYGYSIVGNGGIVSNAFISVMASSSIVPLTSHGATIHKTPRRRLTGSSIVSKGS
jgi:hypothetical protein